MPPDTEALLVYLGKDRLRIGEVECLPCADFLASVLPGRPLAARRS